MKIDQACIDHNVRRLVTELAGDWVYDKPGDDVSKDCAVLTLLEIKGICQLAEALSEVLLE